MELDIEKLLFICSVKSKYKSNSFPIAGLSELKAISFPNLNFEVNEKNSVGLVEKFSLLVP